MTEQLNERERWLMNAAINRFRVAIEQGLSVFRTDDLASHEKCPPDPRTARITELEAEVERLNGLLDEVGEVLAEDWPMYGLLYAILSRRTAERKEPTDASD